MRRMHSLCFVLLIAIAACDPQVTLEGSDRHVTLTYNCERFRPLAITPADQDVVRTQAFRIARHAAARDDQESLHRLSSAYEASTFESLEMVVIAYACEHGVLDEVIRVPVFPDPGSAARDFAMPQLEFEPPFNAGPIVRLTDLRGSVVVLDVFATWCAPCREKQPALRSIAQEYHQKGVRFFGIVYKDSPERAARWLQKSGGAAYPFLLEEGSGMAAEWGIVGVPQLYVIDEKGFIGGRGFGYSAERLPAFLDSLVSIVPPDP